MESATSKGTKMSLFAKGLLANLVSFGLFYVLAIAYIMYSPSIVAVVIGIVLLVTLLAIAISLAFILILWFRLPKNIRDASEYLTNKNAIISATLLSVVTLVIGIVSVLWEVFSH